MVENHKKRNDLEKNEIKEENNRFSDVTFPNKNLGAIFNRFCVAGCQVGWFLEDLVILFDRLGGHEGTKKTIFLHGQRNYFLLVEFNRQKPFRPEIELLKW